MVNHSILAHQPRPPYHHGDLARVLLKSADEIIEAEGLEAFTLRSCARRAGVSHAAPAHHFGDRAGLLSAYAASVFRDLTLSIKNHVASQRNTKRNAPGRAIAKRIYAKPTPLSFS